MSHKIKIATKAELSTWGWFYFIARNGVQIANTTSKGKIARALKLKDGDKVEIEFKKV